MTDVLKPQVRASNSSLTIFMQHQLIYPGNGKLIVLLFPCTTYHSPSHIYPHHPSFLERKYEWGVCLIGHKSEAEDIHHQSVTSQSQRRKEPKTLHKKSFLLISSLPYLTLPTFTANFALCTDTPYPTLAINFFLLLPHFSLLLQYPNNLFSFSSCRPIIHLFIFSLSYFRSSFSTNCWLDNSCLLEARTKSIHSFERSFSNGNGMNVERKSENQVEICRARNNKLQEGR